MLCSLSHVRLFATPWSPLGSSVHGDSAGKNTVVGCHALLQEFIYIPGQVHLSGWFRSTVF